MLLNRMFSLTVPMLMVATGSVALAQAGSGVWQKSYPVNGKASLRLSSGDAAVEIASCGSCRAIQIRLDWRGRSPGDYQLTEVQSGDHVDFELREKSHFRIGIGVVRDPHITVETPAALDLEARTSDGSLKINGLQGNLELHASDGAVDVSDVTGALRLAASDGSIHIHNLVGSLDSRSSDGKITVDGRLSGLQVRTSDGALDVTLNDGSRLTTASRIESSDGRVTVKVPRSMTADLDIHTSDGKIDCSLPLTMEGFNTANGSGHNLRGHLNGGGVPLIIRTSDGNVSLSSL